MILRSWSQTIAEDRTMFYLKAGFHMIADRRSQIAIRSAMSAIIWKLLLRSSAILRSWSQTIAEDRTMFYLLRSIAIVCDLRSAIRNHMETSLWFYLLRSSTITIAGSQTIADSSFHMIADDRRPYCDLRSAIIGKPAFNCSSLVQKQ